MKKIANAFKNAYHELVGKVTWPTWAQLQSSALVVMVASFIIAIIIAGVDFIFGKFMQFIYSAI